MLYTLWCAVLHCALGTIWQADVLPCLSDDILALLRTRVNGPFVTRTMTQGEDFISISVLVTAHRFVFTVVNDLQDENGS